MKSMSNRKWLLVGAIVVSVLFGQDVALAIFGPIITNLGALLPAA